MNKSHLRKFIFLLFLLLASMPIFAQNSGSLVPAGLDNMSTQIVEIFTGNIVRIILICCLAGCAVAYAFNKDNEKMKRNIIAIGIAIVIIVGASGIVGMIWDASTS